MTASTESHDPYRRLASALSSSTASDVAWSWLHNLEKQSPFWDLQEAQVSPGVVLPSPELDVPRSVIPQSVEPRREAPASGPSEGPVEPVVEPRAALFITHLDAVLAELRESRAETRSRANKSFFAALGLGVLGGVALFLGLGLAFAGVVPIGLSTTATGAVSSLFAAIFWRLYKNENADLRVMVEDLRKIEEARVGLWLALHITDADRRDDAIFAIAERIASTEERALE